MNAGRLEREHPDETFSAVRATRVAADAANALDLAMAIALERGLSVNDAAHVVLAEALDAPLVTADRRLADAAEQAVLLPG